MHPLLERQLRRAFGPDRPEGPAWERLRSAIDSAYREGDDHRRMVERSLAIMSEELHSRNRELRGRLQSIAEQARVLENLHDAALVLDHRGRVVECYAATTRLLGVPATTLLGRSLGDFLRPADPSATARRILAALKAEGRWSGDGSYRRPDGSDGILETTLIVIPRSGRTDRQVLAVGQDVTERRRVDRQLFQAQKLDAIGQLAAGVAHEINTPAQYVTDNLSFLADAFDSLSRHCDGACEAEPGLRSTREEIPPAIQQSLEGMRRIAEIVRGIKLFAHPGSGEKTLVDLNHEVESTIAVSRNEWKYVAELEARLDPELPPVPGFAGEIGHVVLNLVVNAAHAIGEATDNGRQRRGHIVVTTRRRDDRVEVLVTDDGPGISEGIQARIFDPFFTTKPVGKGTGQGLAISQRIVHEKHGGTLRFESTPGRGTTFVVSLPAGPISDRGRAAVPGGMEAA